MSYYEVLYGIQNMACFLQRFITFFSGRSGPGPLGPVRKILVVRSGPEGPQFARSVGTLHSTYYTVPLGDGLEKKNVAL